MSQSKVCRKLNLTRFAAVAIPTAILVGCGDSEIKTYRVAKEDNQPPAFHNHAGGEHAAGTSQRGAVPHIHADIPEGWQEVQSAGMAAAAYQITGGEGQTANVRVIPLPGDRKIELGSVNLWREQELGLTAISAEQLKEMAQTADVGDVKGILVDMTAEPGGPTAARIVGAIAERNTFMWFVKMSGPSGILDSNKEKFVSFLKSLKFHEGAHGEEAHASNTPAPAGGEAVSANAETVPAGSSEPKFQPPANWTEKQAGPMVQRAFDISGDSGQAEVTISRFPGATGGMAANINRWREQLGLPPQNEEDRKSVQMIEVDGNKDSYLVDLKGTNRRNQNKTARMIAVGVPHQGETWFFKLLGDEAVVAKEKDAFVRFIVSAY